MQLWESIYIRPSLSFFITEYLLLQLDSAATLKKIIPQDSGSPSKHMASQNIMSLSNSLDPRSGNGQIYAGRHQHTHEPSPHGAHPASHSPFQHTTLDDDDTGCILIPDVHTAQVLTAGICALFTSIPNRPDLLHPVQANALQRWRTWIQPGNLQPKVDTQYFGLRYVFHIFDDYFFRRALRSRVRLEWVEGSPRELGYYGSTRPDPNFEHSRNTLIEIVRPNEWSQDSVQQLLSTLIHEMAHAVFRLFECRCVQCSRQIHIERGRGLTGHGPEWRKLVEAMEMELNRFFPGFSEIWTVNGWRVGDPSFQEEESRINLFWEIWRRFFGGF